MLKLFDKSIGGLDKDSQFYVLNNTHMPAILSANLITDILSSDCELMMSDEGTTRIAKAHFNAICCIENA